MADIDWGPPQNPFDTMEIPLEAKVAEKKKKRVRKRVIAGVASLCVLSAVASASLYYAYENVWSRTTVPKAAETAVKDDLSVCEPFKAAELECSVEFVTDNDTVAGDFVSQSIEPSTKAKRGSKIQLVYSNGPSEVTTPSVDGLTVDEAKKTLGNLGLTVGEVTYEDDSSLAQGTVIRADVPAGTVVANGSKISLVVSSGSQTIPNFVGKTQELAKTELKNTYFNVKFEEEQSDGAPGVIIKQSQEAGSKSSDPNLVLTVSVSKEVADAEIPDITGKSVDEAQKALASLGFTKIKTVEVEAKEGLTGVIAVVPSAGQKVPTNETVVIVSAKAQQ